MLLIHKVDIPIFKFDVTILVGEACEISDYLLTVKAINYRIDPNEIQGCCITNGGHSYI